jgi:hypothetical protein
LWFIQTHLVQEKNNQHPPYERPATKLSVLWQDPSAAKQESPIGLLVIFVFPVISDCVRG